MKISVVVATYNGQKFIIEQLKSILNQTMKPDEVLIFDDCSIDNTYELIQNFIIENKITTWSLFENNENYGWKKNFMNGLSKAKGDYIFPCDQDDIWHLDKIEKMFNIISNNQRIIVLASNYNPFYQENNKYIITKKVTSTMKEDEKIEKVDFNRQFLFIKRPGCVFCFRQKYLNIIKKLWFSELAHDALLWYVANLLDGLYIYNSITVEFRRHSTNASNCKAETNVVRTQNALIDLEILERLNNFVLEYDVLNKDIKLKIINNNIKFTELRLKLFESKKKILWLKLFIYWRKYYFTFRSLLGDLYVIFR